MLANVKHLDQSLTHSRYPSCCEYSMSVVRTERKASHSGDF